MAAKRRRRRKRGERGNIGQRTGGTLILNPSPVREKEEKTSNVQYRKGKG
jgi:hypothetical protein